MDDRTLLELAAKAAGRTVTGTCFNVPYSDYYWRGPEFGLFLSDHDGVWNPLEDDGDALRLAVELKINVHNSAHSPSGIEFIYAQAKGYKPCQEYGVGENPYAATRRAIVRAAAAIGQETK